MSAKNTILIAGTDTEVGKTVVTAGLIAWLNSNGIKTLGMKPFACGAIRKGKKWIYEDVEILKQVNGDCPRMGTIPNEDEIAPLRWRLPLAPYRASILERRPVNFKKLNFSIRKMQKKTRLLVLEGVGGLLCPLTKKSNLADWAAKRKIPVILVSRLGLGTLNHTLMTLEVAKYRGIKVKGLVLNDFPKTKSDLSKKWNPEDLKMLAKIPILGVFPYLRKLSIKEAEKAWRKNFDFKKIKKTIQG